MLTAQVAAPIVIFKTRAALQSVALELY